MTSLDRQREYWDQAATDSEFESEFGAAMAQRNRALVQLRMKTEEASARALLGIGPGTRALDLACGTGRWSIFFARQGAEVVATDLSEPMVERARENAQRAGLPDIRFLARPLDDFQDLGGFDLIHAGGVLHYLEDLEIVAFGSAAARSLRDHGHPLVRVSVARRRALARLPLRAIYRTREDYRRLFERGDLARDAERHASYVPSVVPKLLPLLAGSPARLESAVRLEASALSSLVARPLLALYTRLTGRGCGEYIEHWFLRFRKASETGP